MITLRDMLALQHELRQIKPRSKQARRAVQDTLARREGFESWGELVRKVEMPLRAQEPRT